MKLKSVIAALLLMAAGLQTAWAQGFRVYKSDGTVAQFSFRTDSIVFYDGIGSDEDFGPFTPVNQCIVGTWYKSKSETVTFREDGTTDYISGGTYQFLPYQGEVLVYNSAKKLKQILRIHNVTAEELVVSTLGGTSFSVWSATQPPQLVTSITLSETSIGLHPDETKRLTATIEPADADNPAVTWTSSNEAVAEVNSSGRVTANAKGTCTISCAATDGSGVYAECQVAVGSSSSSDGQTYTVNGVSFNMIPVAGGTFQMGSTTGDSDEQPVHQVTLSSFSIGETEVTQELWQAVMGSNPSYFKGNKLPVETVSWNDCQTFITKLNELTGKTFRLPTEAEWEYAARGGNQSKGYTYSGSNTIGDVAWYWGNIPSQSSGAAGYGTQPVATKAPNELGIYDMSGNVREWCQDWDGSYSSGSQTNPTGPSSGSYRVHRGGSWYDHATFCRVADRGNSTPAGTFNRLGLRLAQ